MLVGIMYVLVPMPYLFFGSTGGDGYAIYGSSIQSGCVLPSHVVCRVWGCRGV